MFFNLFIDDYKKIDFNDLKKEKNMDIGIDDGYINVKLDSNELNIAISDLDKEDIEDKKSDFYKVYMKCNYRLEILASNVEDVKLIYELGMYISKYSQIILVDVYNHYCFINDELKIDDRLFNEYKIHFKFIPVINDLLSKVKKTKLSKSYWIYLSIASLLSSFLLIFMIIGLDISNFFILVLPFVITLGVFLYIPVSKIINNNKINKKIMMCNYNKSIELCDLYNKKHFKQASLTNKNVKQLIINICGIAILPTIIIGSILISIEYVLGGIFIILLPWLVLFGIKLFVTDKENNNIREEINLIFGNIFNNLTNDITSIKFEIIDNKNNNWGLNVIGYKEFNLDRLNMLDYNVDGIVLAKTNLIFKDNWESVEKIINGYIYLNIDKYIKKETFNKIESIILGFKDGYDYALYEKVKKVD